MKIFTKAAFILGITAVALSSNVKDPSNPPAGNTGAPGETTCASCHSGGAYTGTLSLTGLPDTVLPNTTYNLTFTTTSNCVRSGFQMTCLTAANIQCGTFTVGTGTSVITVSSRQYIRQSQVRILSGGATAWTFTWKSPATLTGNTITFYYASLLANGGGTTAGDNVLSGNKVVRFKSTTNSEDLNNAIALSVYPNPATESINIELTDVSNATMTLTDISGRIVMVKDLNDTNTKVNVANLARGIYNMQVVAGAKSTSRKISIQ